MRPKDLASRGPSGTITRAHLRRLISRIQVLQLDSVSVAVRAHYAPVFSRLGPYDRAVLDRAAWEHYRPLAAAAGGVLGARGRADGGRRLAAAALADAPIPARPVGHPHRQGQPAAGRQDRRRRRRTRSEYRRANRDASGRRPARSAKGAWWGSRSDTKWVAEALFASGVLTTATRVGFARHYDLTERVLPPDVLARRSTRTTPSASSRCGRPPRWVWPPKPTSATTSGWPPGQAKPAIAKLVADGELERVDVDGWSAPAYLPAGQTIPRRDRGTALLCPFDPLIFFRPRVERLFEFHYRIEIYTPATSANTATTSGRFCWTVSWSGGSTSRPTVPRMRCTSWVRSSSRIARRRGWPRRWHRSLRRWRRGWDWVA